MSMWEVGLWPLYFGMWDVITTWLWLPEGGWMLNTGPIKDSDVNDLTQIQLGLKRVL